MRCLACNGLLNQFDATVKYASTGEYLDLCSSCRMAVARDVQLIERADLATEEPEEGTEDGE